MSVFDDFYDNTHIFKGEVPESPSVHNLNRLITENGKDWVRGYLKAMEVAAIDLANILQPRENNPCGFEQTPHMVCTNVKKYWDHNKSLYVSLSSQLQSVESVSKEVKQRQQYK